MDHFPPVSDPHELLQVPYLGGEYDGKAFDSFPRRQGWDVQRLQAGNIETNMLDSARTFLQTWFYFGMLHEVLGLEIKTADFIRVDAAGAAYITTIKLRSYLHAWRDSLSPSSDADGISRRNRRITDCWAYSYHVWQEFDKSAREFLIPPEIELSIQILAATLEHAVLSVYNLLSASHIPVALAPWRLTRSDFLTQRMLDDGWCPSTLQQIWFPTHLTLQYYAHLLGPPRFYRRHEHCAAGDIACKSRNLNEEMYETKHLCPSFDCRVVEVDATDLQNIVKSGGIALVRVAGSAPNITLQVVPFRQGMQYTAISHVWSDGLGNPRTNALPTCQLVELARLLGALPAYDADDKAPSTSFEAWQEHVSVQDPATLKPAIADHVQYFWMDTLCVPVQPNDTRKQAIVSMRSIYRGANRILVFDAELKSSTFVTSLEEKLSRIACSAWVRRLWTLLEGVMAPKIYFQFAEAPFLFDLYPNQDFEEKYYDNPVGAISQESDLTHSKWAIGTGLLRTIRTFQALKSRSTTKEGDQAICVASILDMDLAQLLSVPDHERVKKLWSMFREVPAATLFLPGKKLKCRVFGWAPASCSDCRFLAIPIDVPAHITPKGLCVSLSGFFLDTPREPVEGVIACELDGEIFYVRRNVKWGSPGWDGLDLHRASRLAVILGQDPWSDDARRPGLVACIAALVHVVASEGDMVVVEYIRFASVIKKGCRYDFSPNPPWSDREEAEKTRVGMASFTKGDQKWLVGASYGLGRGI